MLTFLLQLALTLSSGLLAGAGVTYALVCVPQALAASDPLLPTWKKFLLPAGKLAVANIAISFVLAIGLFLLTGNYRYLLICAMIAGILQYTFKNFYEANDKMIKMTVEEGAKNPKMVRDTIELWGHHQKIRAPMKVAVLLVAAWANQTCQ